MSYDLYFWKWRTSQHVSPATCFLLMAEGLECVDAAVFDTSKLKAALLRSLARSSSGRVEWDVQPCGLKLEAHGVDVVSLLEVVSPVAQAHQAVLFDPQTADVSADDRQRARDIAQAFKSQDETVRIQAEMPELIAHAETGDSQALVELGNRFFFGEGIAKDLEKAFGCFLKAAEGGSDAGMVNVASCFRNGEGTKKDLGLALRWYEEALKTDRTFAPFELAGMYETGEGVPADRERAVQLLFVALEGDHPQARAALRRLGELPPVPRAFVRR